ncbi:hypothetical protein PhiH1_280 [Halobacterium phage phiH]|uniref:Uncharacterized protein n=1 Tax=Halobacterium phage phiH TaxID=169684 RepID=A0A3G1ZKT9_BPPHH|nr:hypothetical protein JR051_gp57 [Halobacterium phage phiH]AYM00302.1 hypothetical protein PhiH1_280 [Halobacterium phage phiH]
MSTPSRTCHLSRSRCPRRRHRLSRRLDVSDARGTVLVTARLGLQYGLKEIEIRRREPNAGRGNALDTRSFSPRCDNFCASKRGVTVSLRGGFFGSRRFAMSSRTNGSHNTTRRYATAG